MKRTDLRDQVEHCLVEHFHVPRLRAERQPRDYPSLPLLLSLLDLAIDRNRPLPEEWSRERLAQARSAIEYIIFAVLDEHLRTVARNWYEDLFTAVQQASPDQEPWAISLNYDILLDNVIFQIAEARNQRNGRPDYGCDIQTEAYTRRSGVHGRLLKLHGSLNWLYCACCHRLEMGMSECGRAAVTCKILNELYAQKSLDEHYGGKASRCMDCGTLLRPVMITPTRAKDYRNPHIQKVWYEAERMLRRADHVYFIGYSLPDDDIEVIDLLRRGLPRQRGTKITVIVHDEQGRALRDNPVGQRYRSLFGNEIDWRTEGFGDWLTRTKQLTVLSQNQKTRMKVAS